MRTPTPADLATAREALLHPETINHHPALMQAAWSTFAAARGVRIEWDRLEPQHHLYTRQPAPPRVVPIRTPATPAPTLAATLAQIAPRITAAVSRRLHDGGAA